MRDPRYVIAVPGLERSAEFYREVLGFEIREIGDSGWRFHQRGGVMREFGIRTVDGHRIMFGRER